MPSPLPVAANPRRNNATGSPQRIAKKTGDEWVVKAAIRPVVKRLDPTFDESNYECKTFAELLKKYPKSFKIKQGEHDHLVSLIG